MNGPDYTPPTRNQSRYILACETPVILGEFELVVEYMDQENELVRHQIELIPLMENPLSRILNWVSQHTIACEGAKPTRHALPTTWADPTLPLIPQVVTALLSDLSCYVFSPVAFVSGKHFTEQQFLSCDSGAVRAARKGFYK
jgi:hypothetical protein